MDISIEKLIPQRYPIKVVDSLVDVNGEDAVCQLTLRADNCFIEGDGKMAEPGLIEHIAQSASAFAGYRAVAAGAVEPPVGYIGEVKGFQCNYRPSLGETLLTTISMGPQAEGVTLISAVVRSGENVVAQTRMKIFVNQ